MSCCHKDTGAYCTSRLVNPSLVAAAAGEGARSTWRLRIRALCGSWFSSRKALCRLFDVASRRAHNFLLLGLHPWRQPVAPDCTGKGQQSARAAGRKGLGSAGGWLGLSVPHIGLFASVVSRACLTHGG